MNETSVTSITHARLLAQQIPCTQGDSVRCAEQVLHFHERLNGVIILWATMIDALLQVDTHECYTLAFALLDLQPDAMYVDHVMLRTESEVRG